MCKQFGWANQLERMWFMFKQQTEIYYSKFSNSIFSFYFLAGKQFGPLIIIIILCVSGWNLCGDGVRVLHTHARGEGLIDHLCSSSKPITLSSKQKKTIHSVLNSYFMPKPRQQDTSKRVRSRGIGFTVHYTLILWCNIWTNSFDFSLKLWYNHKYFMPFVCNTQTSSIQIIWNVWPEKRVHCHMWAITLFHHSMCLAFI